ncbi:MAG: terminase family protein [Ignavibacteriaceae bacterium]
MTALVKHITGNIPEDTIDYFLSYQQRWITDPHQISIRDKSRRTGGTQTVAFEALLWAFETDMPDRDIWFTSADKKAAEEFILAVKKWAKIFNLVSETMGEQLINPEDEDKFYLKYEIRIPLGNGEFIRVNALSSNVNSFHGKQGFMIVDEMARHKDQVAVWEGAFPATLWGYPLRIISTQNGKGLFWKLCEDCKKGKHPNWGYHHTDIYEAVEDGLYDKIKGRPTTKEERQQWIDEIHKNCLTESVWNQQFLCRAEDENEAFLPYELIYSVHDNSILLQQNILPIKWNGEKDGIIYGPEDNKSKWVHETIRLFKEWWLKQEFNQLLIGVDVARSKHLTVFWIADKNDIKIKVTRLIIELQAMPYWVQFEIGRALFSHNKVRRVCVDKTGKGENLFEDWYFEFGSIIEGVGFTNSVKEKMAERFKASFEDKTIRIPEDTILSADLHSVRKETTAAGNVRLAVNTEVDEEGNEIGHADRFWAGALMEHADEVNTGPVHVISGRYRESKKLLSDYTEQQVLGIILMLVFIRNRRFYQTYPQSLIDAI